MERGKTETGEQVVRVRTSVLATEIMACKDALQCELMWFLEKTHTCSCVLCELEEGGN